MSSEQRPRIVMDVCRDGWTGGLQLGIAALDENDHGDGYRIAGPKYSGSQEALLSRDLDERDAREIRGYLDRAFPIGDEEAEQQASVRQYGQGLAPMSPERLAEIAEREAAATAGPWGAFRLDETTHIGSSVESTSSGAWMYEQLVAAVEDHDYWVDDLGREVIGQASARLGADVAFIAHAREDVPALLAEVGRLRAERDRYRSAWQSARERATAHREGTLRQVATREQVQRWLKERETEVGRLRAELAARVQCDDCGAIGDVAVGADGLRRLAPSGQCAYPVVSLASLPASHDESGGEGRG